MPYSQKTQYTPYVNKKQERPPVYRHPRSSPSTVTHARRRSMTSTRLPPVILARRLRVKKAVREETSEETGEEGREEHRHETREGAHEETVTN